MKLSKIKHKSFGKSFDESVIKMKREFLQIIEKLLELIKKGKIEELNEIPHVSSREEQIENLKNEIVSDLFQE